VHHLKKEVKQLNDALKEKYKAHDEYAKAYKNIMNKEKDMFVLLDRQQYIQTYLFLYS
jgi:vacuolar-type H+-ATPase subunit I/STV1